MLRIPTLRIPRAATAFAAVTVLGAGLLTAPAFANVGFDNRMAAVVQQVGADPNYKRIPLATSADRAWFSELAENLYTNKITKEQFVAEGVQRFPGYDASFSTVADLMTSK